MISACKITSFFHNMVILMCNFASLSGEFCAFMHIAKPQHRFFLRKNTKFAEK